MSRTVSECEYCGKWYADDESEYGVHPCYLKPEHLSKQPVVIDKKELDKLRQTNAELTELLVECLWQACCVDGVMEHQFMCVYETVFEYFNLTNKMPSEEAEKLINEYIEKSNIGG